MTNSDNDIFEKAITLRHRSSKFKVLLVSLACIPFSACWFNGGKNRTNVEVFTDMIQQKNIKAQEGDQDQATVLMPPPHSIARNRVYYPYTDDPERASKELKNPLYQKTSPYLTALGKRQYEKACIYCHGVKGGGDGEVAKKMNVRVPELFSKKTTEYSDGQLYHIIHEGIGLMGSYRKQVREDVSRWALVNYVRLLQKNYLEKQFKEKE